MAGKLARTAADRRVAAITGGSGGIGAATGRWFSQAGWDVALLDLDRDHGEALAASMSVGGTGRARFFPCDVSDAGQVDAVAAAVLNDLGPVDVLVTSAALIPNSETVMDMDLDAHDRMWRVNYFGTVHACRSFGRQMIERERGAICLLSSINALLPLPLPAYNPGKVAVSRLTQLLAVELGRHRIRVNSVAPTYVMTPALQARIDSGLRDIDKMMSVHALDRLPTPDDVAEAIAWLCSDQARSITGVTLPVDAGWAASVSYKTYAGGVPWSQATPG